MANQVQNDQAATHALHSDADAIAELEMAAHPRRARDRNELLRDPEAMAALNVLRDKGASTDEVVAMYNRIGQRMRDDSEPVTWPSGAYGIWAGRWFAKTPNGEVADLSRHIVTEDSGDGERISVNPSILVREPGSTRALYHGWLTEGVWRDV